MNEPPAVPGALPVSAPPRVRDLLRAAPDGPVRVVHRGRHALYLDLHGWCVGVVTRSAAQVPCALRTRERDLSAFSSLPLLSAYLGKGTIHIGGRPLPVGRSVDVRTPRIDPGRIPGTTAGSTTAATPHTLVVGLVEDRPPPRIGPDSVPRILGRGDGLTPFGDDVLCGWLATHRAVGVPTPEVDAAVRAQSHRTTLLSATLLDCAMHGEVLPEFAAWLTAIGTPAEPEREARLLRVGASSGAGLLAGARLAFDDLTRGVLAA